MIRTVISKIQIIASAEAKANGKMNSNILCIMLFWNG
jgi:hypothetical protein